MTISNTRKPVSYPTGGKTTHVWFANGYQAAMADIAAIVDIDTREANGELSDPVSRLNAIRDWIENNSGILFD